DQGRHHLPEGLLPSQILALPIEYRAATDAFSSIRDLDEAAVVFGYMMARAEARETVLPIAKKGRRGLRGARRPALLAAPKKGEKSVFPAGPTPMS
ncbi:hypothetical protein, partial [Caulobacter sp. B11]|uniref:hypothetical protein n=1 Tax=Caulobacter sp. B11 TaxID=2048899 RepID=UPI0013747F32